MQLRLESERQYGNCLAWRQYVHLDCRGCFDGCAVTLEGPGPERAVVYQAWLARVPYHRAGSHIGEARSITDFVALAVNALAVAGGAWFGPIGRPRRPGWWASAAPT